MALHTRRGVTNKFGMKEDLDTNLHTGRFSMETFSKDALEFRKSVLVMLKGLADRKGK